VLTLNVGEQRRASSSASRASRAISRPEVGGLSVKPFVKLLAEKELDSSGRPIRYAGTAAPTIVNSFRPSKPMTTSMAVSKAASPLS
jgi:hypothetical protein